MKNACCYYITYLVT